MKSLLSMLFLVLYTLPIVSTDTVRQNNVVQNEDAIISPKRHIKIGSDEFDYHLLSFNARIFFMRQKGNGILYSAEQDGTQWYASPDDVPDFAQQQVSPTLSAASSTDTSTPSSPLSTTSSRTSPTPPQSPSKRRTLVPSERQLELERQRKTDHQTEQPHAFDRKSKIPQNNGHLRLRVSSLQAALEQEAQRQEWQKLVSLSAASSNARLTSSHSTLPPLKLPAQQQQTQQIHAHHLAIQDKQH